MKKNSFLSGIIYYHIPQLLIIGIFAYCFSDYFFQLFCMLTSTEERDFLYNPLHIFTYLMLFTGWVYIAFVTLRNRRYKWLTNRSYPSDHAKFHKTYSELVAFWTTNDKYRMNVESLPIEDWHKADGVILAKYRDKAGNYHLIKRDSNADGNLASFGLPGSGKSTTQAATTFRRFNAHLKKGGCGVFAISIKGDLLNFVKGKRKNIKVFTPDKEEGSWHYNPLEGVAQMSQTERRSFAENMSIIICPDEQGENSTFFVSGARDYLCGTMLYLLYLHDIGEREGELKFHEIVDAILSGNVFDVTMTIKNSGCAIAAEYTNSYEGSSEKNVSGIYNHLCKKVRPFNTGALRVLFDGEGECIHPEDLNTGDIVIDVPQDKYSIYAPAMAIIVTNFLMAFMRREDVSANKKVVPIMFLLDEAVQLNLDFNLLSQAMSTLRSKKVSIFLLMQSVAQLEGRYGEAHARELIDLCAYISVFNAQDPKSRRYFQELVGRRKMLKRSTSLSSSANNNNSSGTSVSEADEFIFEAADFGDLNIHDTKTGEITKYQVLVYANGKYILGETTPCYS
ncbi:Type IV secretory pathway, VirD4 component, TraG/TraD family ATPase [Lachnospiraceae bacterium XBB1006]|nr:Type IV secretory pathway, VirD4 component, TraG/TraD family ATPase [Lachnospiraceae bacterium XBB1006]